MVSGGAVRGILLVAWFRTRQSGAAIQLILELLLLLFVLGIYLSVSLMSHACL